MRGAIGRMGFETRLAMGSVTVSCTDYPALAVDQLARFFEEKFGVSNSPDWLSCRRRKTCLTREEFFSERGETRSSQGIATVAEAAERAADVTARTSIEPLASGLWQAAKWGSCRVREVGPVPRGLSTGGAPWES